MIVFAWCRFAAAVLCLGTGLVFMGLAVFGVNRFRKALNRMHAAALGDTLGILFVFLGLIIIRGFSLDSLKLFLVILFFWIASPVSGHMISRLEAMTDEHLGEILIIDKMKDKEKKDKKVNHKGENEKGKRIEEISGKEKSGKEKSGKEKSSKEKNSKKISSKEISSQEKSDKEKNNKGKSSKEKNSIKEQKKEDRGE